jgi:hypothetical protein
MVCIESPGQVWAVLAKCHLPEPALLRLLQPHSMNAHEVLYPAHSLQTGNLYNVIAGLVLVLPLLSSSVAATAECCCCWHRGSPTLNWLPSVGMIGRQNLQVVCSAQTTAQCVKFRPCIDIHQASAQAPDATETRPCDLCSGLRHDRSCFPFQLSTGQS